MPLGLPSLQSVVLDQAGRFTQAWIGFFSGLTAPPGPIQSVDATSSPVSFKAAVAGSLAVSGGAAVEAAITRARQTVPSGVSSGMVALSQGDVATITFTAPPSIAFLPRGGL
jgi:hypothetical protein